MLRIQKKKKKEYREQAINKQQNNRSNITKRSLKEIKP